MAQKENHAMTRINKITASVVILVTALGQPVHLARADMFGGDIIVLGQILMQAVEEVYKLQSILGNTADTVRLLEEMNRGVKDVLRLAETAHAPLPPGVYEQAKKIDQALWEAKRVYGEVGTKAPIHTRSNYRSGVEALSISQDAFDYSTYLDQQGTKVKSSAVVADPTAAARLTAETMGVLLHASDHANRLQAKSLELSSNTRLESSAKENAQFESYINTHRKIEDEMKASSFSSLNSIGAN